MCKDNKKYIGIVVNTRKDKNNSSIILDCLNKILSKYKFISKVIDYDITDTYYMEKAIKELLDVKAIVSVGGDGTLLSALKIAINYDIPVLPIYNGTLGFIAEIEPAEGYLILEDYLKDNRELYSIEKRILLSLTINNDKELYAVNDVVISKTKGRPVALNVKISGSSSDVKLLGDGVIIATPTGSTAYALSVGGPIMFHSMKAIVFVPIAPHSLTFRPLIIPEYNSIDIKLAKGYEVANIDLDGDYIYELKTDEEIKIKVSDKYCYIMQSKNRSFYDILRDKLNWGI